MIELSTPSLLFPAASLLFLAYTNRYNHVAGLTRSLLEEWIVHGSESRRRQIENLRLRLRMIRFMQWSIGVSLLLCLLSMMAFMGNFVPLAKWTFTGALIASAGSLSALLREVQLSGSALAVLFAEAERRHQPAGGRIRH